MLLKNLIRSIVVSVATALVRRLLKRFFVIILAFSLCMPAFAQERGRGLPLVRDAEVEMLMADYARPILGAAGLGGRGIQVTLLADSGFNAFVADGRRIFITVGAITQSTTPNEIIGVLAHETGHIAGGHLARLREQISHAQTLSIISLLLGAGAIAAGASAGGRNSGIGDVAPGILLGPQEAIRRNLLSYQRSEELTADRSAINYLNATGQSARGMLDTFRRFQEELGFNASALDRYTLSHPMPRERVASLEELARKSPHFEKKDPANLQFRHDMARAKIVGFVERPDSVARRYPAYDQSMPAQYARAIAAYRSGRIALALQEIDRLVKQQPNNPFFLELKGQALLEAGRAREAIAPLRAASAKLRGAGLVRGLLGHALLSTGDDKLLDEALRELRVAVEREPEYAVAYRHLAMAYGRKGNIALAELASAKGYLLDGDLQSAREQASRARSKLPENSPDWQKADEILNRKKEQ